MSDNHIIGALELDKVISYVRSLQKETGGFGATRRLPATIEDTFHGVAIFKFLAEQFSRPEQLAGCRDDALLHKFIAGLWPGDTLDLKSVYQLFATAADLHAPLDPVPVRKLAAQRLKQRPSLSTFYHAGLILGKACAPLLEEQLGPNWPQRLFPARHTCEEMMMGLTIIRAGGGPGAALPGNDLAAWFQECQTADGGFGFLPGTTSFIENSHFCLQALRLLDSQPRDLSGAVSFISGCQTLRGGFGRRGRAAPFLDATYHAMASLAILSEPL